MATTRLARALFLVAVLAVHGAAAGRPAAARAAPASGSNANSTAPAAAGGRSAPATAGNVTASAAAGGRRPGAGRRGPGGERPVAPGGRPATAAAEMQSMPIYGNWCGPRWGSGQPIDAVDACCQKHDLCYDAHGYFDCACDHALLECFANVHVPASQERTRAFKNVAAVYFRNTLCRTGRNDWLWARDAGPLVAAKLRALKNATADAAAGAGAAVAAAPAGGAAAAAAPLVAHAANATLPPQLRAAARLAQAAAAAIKNVTTAHLATKAGHAVAA
ncbi:hypothetical protein Rsub_06923 [Raphidocelis subcapitata]|uniref:Phospholipase A2-like central domain-containing protein n=1 Tax=Raphidocelis subcapitata TaxID=307507 RepID=A0A2V0P348_9CHLO|nr:hypothetical protein Rsub_06923 [Raphidocelis subcapitata]|eukprot:GBF94301.1 hypothetical protein Rsub_06923 [Raphidocelis subcapitata]